MSVKKDLWRSNLPYFEPIYLNDDQVIAIVCQTEEDAIALFNVLDENGYKWNGGERLRDINTCWHDYGQDTCYYLNYHGSSRKCIVFGGSEPEKNYQWYQFSASYIPQFCKIDIMDMV